MEVKLCLVMMLIILGTLTVQGAIPRNKKRNPLEVFATPPPILPLCIFYGGCCRTSLPCPDGDDYYPDLICLDQLPYCCVQQWTGNDGGNDVTSME